MATELDGTVVIDGTWKEHALRGTAALALGVLTLVWPGLTVLALVLLFGAFALVDGVSYLLALFTTAKREPLDTKAILGLQGVVGVGAGLVTVVWPDITALALLYVIAAWAFVNGVAQIAAAIRLRKEMKHEWLVVITGLVSIAFAVMLVITPGAGALVITWLIAWFAILAGALQLGLAWRLHRIENELEHQMHGPINAAPA